MNGSLSAVLRWIAGATLALCAVTYLAAQETAGPSLGDFARSERKERSTPGHSGAKRLFSEEDDGPDPGGVWRVDLCTQTQPICYDLSVTLPKTLKWARAVDQPRPVLIAVPGEEQDPAHTIRVYAAELLPPFLLDLSKRTFLQSWFARPEYFGQSARIVRDEHVRINNFDAVISHFSVESGADKYRGVSVITASGYGNHGFACTYPDDDAGVAGSICDAVIQSASAQILQPQQLPLYPGPYYPPYYPQPYYPPDGDP